MLTWLMRAIGLIRFAMASKKARAEAREAREMADALRDEGQWSDAAAKYRKFLRIYRNNSDIWVQLGNMNKEARHYGRADAAYNRARRLSPRDAEPCIQLGHLRRRQGDLAAAAKFYQRAAAIDPKSYAAVELRKPDIQALVRSKAGGGLRSTPATLRRIGSRCDGVTVTAGEAVLPLDHDGLFNLVSDDPWFEFKLERKDSARFGVLDFDIEWVDIDDSEPPFSRFYIDYGKGYTEEYTLNLLGDRAPVSSILLAAPEHILSMRFDPDSQPNTMRLRRLAFRPLASIGEVDKWLEEHPRDQREGDIDMPDIGTFIDAASVTAADAAELQYLLPVGFDKGFNYDYWRRRFVDPTPDDYVTIARMQDEFSIRPKYSFVMPVYNPPVELLRECIQSMLDQTYQDFELCIADDASTDLEIAKLLNEFAAADERVKVCFRPRNGHISAASNSALELATGDYVVLVDHDDLLPDYALFVISYYINRNPDARVIYSDEDKISPEGKLFQPYFKSDFNKFLMYGHNMISHIGVYKTSLLQEIGGFRLGLEGSQDYDLFMRCLERIDERQIVHIPHVLYHWRAIPGSTAVSADQKDYAIHAAQGAINGYFERSGTPLRSVGGFAPGCTAVKATAAYETSVSIIIPTRDGVDILKPCIDSIFATKPTNCQIIIVDNQSTDPETLEYFEDVRALGVEILSYPHPFNFSAINNFAVGHATGDILCFLNNDTEVLSAKWLDRARAFLAMPDIGMVGARLLFPDMSVQHYGIVLGMGTHRVAGTPHAGFPRSLPGYFGKLGLIQEFSAVTAACMFVRKSDFERIGGFDEELRIAYNDIDLCLKLRTQIGTRIVCDPEMELIHKESRSRGSDKKGDRAARLEKEAQTMRDRWGDILLKDPYYSPNLTLDRVDFTFAYPPRAPMPWRVQAATGDMSTDALKLTGHVGWA